MTQTTADMNAMPLQFLVVPPLQLHSWSAHCHPIRSIKSAPIQLSITVYTNIGAEADVLGIDIVLWIVAAVRSWMMLRKNEWSRLLLIKSTRYSLLLCDIHSNMVLTVRPSVVPRESRTALKIRTLLLPSQYCWFVISSLGLMATRSVDKLRRKV